MKRFLTFVSLFALLAGCDLPDEGQALASVDGVVYTRADLERDCAVMRDLYALAQIAPEENGMLQSPAEFRKGVVKGFVTREVLVREAERRHMEISPAEMAAYQERYAADFSVRLPMNFEAIMNALGKRATEFRNNLKREALAYRLQRTIRSDLAAQVRVGRADAVREREAAVRSRAKAIADNKALGALAQNAWKSIRAGNDFAAVGRKLQELRREVSFEPACDIADPQFRRLSMRMYSRPVAVEDGLVLVRAVRPDGSAGRFERIFFRMQKLPPVQSVEDTLATMRRRAVDEAYDRWFEQVKAAASVSVNSL